MTIQITSEVASAHRNLEKLCEKFEASVEELCDRTPQSIHSQEFYECECVPIAVECVDALSKLQSACSYESQRMKAEIAAADDALREQKRELEKNAVQRAKTYENAVAAANNALRKTKQKLEKEAAQRAKVYERAVAEAESTFHQQKRELAENADRNIRDIEHKCQQLGVDISLTEGETTPNASVLPSEI